jgi:hypothetical protein
MVFCRFDFAVAIWRAKMPDFAGKTRRFFGRSPIAKGWQTPRKRGIKQALAIR